MVAGGEPGPEVGELPGAAKRASPCSPAVSQPEGGRAHCNMAIAQRQQGRLCFAFLFEKKTKKGRTKGGDAAKTQCAPLPLSFIEAPSPKTTSLALLPRFCGVLARSKSAKSS